jgi:hypothetical protein
MQLSGGCFDSQGQVRMISIFKCRNHNAGNNMLLRIIILIDARNCIVYIML